VSWEQVDRDAISSFAREVGPDAGATVDRLESTLATLRDRWSVVREQLPMLGEHQEALFEHWRRVPLLRRMGALDT